MGALLMTIFRLLNEKADIERIESCINNDPACVTSEIHSNSPGLSQMLSPLHVAVKRKRPDVVKLLLDKKADPNKQATRIYGTDANFTPLTMAAIQPGGIEILKLLLDNGGDPNAGFEFQEPLPQALLKTREESTQQDLTENIRLLLEYEGDPN